MLISHFWFLFLNRSFVYWKVRGCCPGAYSKVPAYSYSQVSWQLGLFAKEQITFRKPFLIMILTLSWFEILILHFLNAKLFQIGLLKCKNRAFWIVIRLESLILKTWNAKLCRMWFVHVHFGNARWNHAWVSQHSRYKILPRCAQTLFVIGTAVAMLVNAHSSNHKLNQEADMNTHVFLLGTHPSARRMHLKYWHLFQPIANSSFVCVTCICQNCIPSKIFSSNILSCDFIYNSNRIFKSWEFYALLPGTS